VLNRLIQDISELDLRQYKRWLTIALALCLLALLTQLLWRSYLTFYFQPTIALVSPPPQGQQYDAKTITAANLFGRTLVGPTAAKLPSTRLQLILRGAFGASTPEKGSAMIEDGNGVTRTYRVNMQVGANTQLHSVFPNHVVLSRDGQLEVLKFPSPGSDAGNARPNSNNSVSIDQSGPRAKSLDSTSMSAQQRQQLIKTRLQELRNRSKNKG